MSIQSLHDEINFAHGDNVIFEDNEGEKQHTFAELKRMSYKAVMEPKNKIIEVLKLIEGRNITSIKIVKAINTLKEYKAWDISEFHPYTKEDIKDIEKNIKRVIAYLKKHNFI